MTDADHAHPGPVSSGRVHARLPRRAGRRLGAARIRLPRVLRRVLRVPEITLVAAVAFLARCALRLVLPVAGAAALLHAFPYQATVLGVPFRVQGSILARPYVSADTTLGNWVFPHVDGLPLGVHISPVDVNVLQLARDASGDTPGYVESLRENFTEQLPHIGLWLAGEVLLGIVLGLVVAAAILMSARYLRQLPRRGLEPKRRLVELTGIGLVLAVVVGYGAATYNPNWARQSRLTGTLAAAQLFPAQLQQYYQQQSKAFDVVNAILGIQGTLQSQFSQRTAPPTAFPILFISDMHLAAAYPLVRRYAQNYGVRLIVNTGDESEFGKAAELTPAYLNELSALTRDIPMLWLAGNHDSPEVEGVMRRVPGVTVLGTKTRRPDGAFAVRAGVVDAFGLTIAGVPDPRVYGGPGAYGSDQDSETDPLERDAVDAAVLGVPGTFDIFATHEPVAARRLREDLPDRIRQTNAGHTHVQNSSGDIQNGKQIDLVEGTTGAGGLDNIGKPGPRPPIQFSIESVAANCQFTQVQRFSINALTTANAADAERYGDDAIVSTSFFRPQDLPTDRLCGTSFGIGPARLLTPGAPTGGRPEAPSGSPSASASVAAAG